MAGRRQPGILPCSLSLSDQGLQLWVSPQPAGTGHPQIPPLPSISLLLLLTQKSKQFFQPAAYERISYMLIYFDSQWSRIRSYSVHQEIGFLLSSGTRAFHEARDEQTLVFSETPSWANHHIVPGKKSSFGVGFAISRVWSPLVGKSL